MARLLFLAGITIHVVVLTDQNEELNLVKQFAYAAGESEARFKGTPTFLPLKTLRTNDTDPQEAILDQKLIGDSAAMVDLKQAIRVIAKSSETVLISGESGTGKELIARAIHDLSPRRRGPYVAVNCGALTESLLESELFGHVKGAFTGAIASKKGFFEAASGGTLFLDEFAEMSLNTQQRLLRVLQERTVRPIGSTDHREIKIDTRVIVATNHNLNLDVKEGRFRKDLFYRVNVLEIRAPALCERGEDIRLLAAHFIRHYNEKNRTDVSDVIGTKALALLKVYDWPGNVRELENLIKRLALKVGVKATITEPDILSLSEFSDFCLSSRTHCAQSMKQKEMRSGRVQREVQCRCSQELEWYRGRLKDAGGSVTEAARQLNIPRTTFRYRMMILKSKCAP